MGQKRGIDQLTRMSYIPVLMLYPFTGPHQPLLLYWRKTALSWLLLDVFPDSYKPSTKSNPRPTPAISQNHTDPLLTHISPILAHVPVLSWHTVPASAAAHTSHILAYTSSSGFSYNILFKLPNLFTNFNPLLNSYNPLLAHSNTVLTHRPALS